MGARRAVLPQRAANIPQLQSKNMVFGAGQLWEYDEFYAVDRAVDLGMIPFLDMRVDCARISVTLKFRTNSDIKESIDT